MKKEPMSVLPFYSFRNLSNVRTFFKSSIPQGVKEQNIEYGVGTIFGENVCIEPNVRIGKNCFIGSNTVIRNDTVIGNNCVVGHLVLIETKVRMGNDSTVQSQCSITQGTKIGSHVFIGPCVVTANDLPMVKYHPERGPFICDAPVFEDWCSVGAASHILPGVVIGKRAIIGMGSTVTRSVPPGETWIGMRARRKEDQTC